MSEVVGVAEVIIRPVTTGFAAAAESGISKEGRDIGRDLSKAILAGFAIGGVVEGIKSVVEAATKQNTAFAVLDQTLKNAGQSVEGFSASLHDKLEAQARATGVSAEDLAAAMSRLVPVTGNVGKSIKDLNTAIGISETFHIGLKTAALALAKAETGSYTSLQRYLGKIPQVTTAQDALKARYQALLNSNVKLDAQQKAAYTTALATAKAADAQASSVNALAAAQQKFAGVPQTFAKTYQGQFERLHVAVDQLKVAVGTELVGGLAAGSGALADYLDKLLLSDRVQKEMRNDIESLRGAFLDVKSVVEAVGPPVLSLTQNLGGFVRVAEIIGTLLVARKILAWAEGLGVASAAEATTAASTSVLTDALIANTAALTANTAALGENDAAQAINTETRVAGDAATVGSIGGLSLLRLALLRLGATYLAVNQIIKLFPGEHDLGLDFSNNTAGFVKGANGSPYQKGSPNDQLYQAGRAGQKGPTIHLLDGATAQLGNLGEQGGKAYRAGLAKGLTEGPTLSFFGPGNQLKQLIKKATDSPAVEAAVAAQKATAQAKNQALLATEQTLKDTIASDKTDLALIKTNLADAITQGAQAVVDAVTQAKQNLNSIGGSLAQEIQAVLVKPITDAQQQITDAQDKLSLATSQTTLKNLGQSVLLPGGKQLSSDPQRAIVQLQALEKKTSSPALAAFIQQYQSAFLSERSAGLTVANDTLTAQGAHAASRISNLTDLVNTGRLSKTAFGTRIGAILKNLGITPGAADREFGVSGSDTLKGLEQGLLQQAGAITSGPQRAGSGLIPSITRPLQTLHDQQRQINQLRHEEAQKELAESRAQTKLLRDIANGKAASKFTSSLDRNPGSKSKKTQALTGVNR